MFGCSDFLGGIWRISMGRMGQGGGVGTSKISLLGTTAQPVALNPAISFTDYGALALVVAFIFMAV